MKKNNRTIGLLVLIVLGSVLLFTGCPDAASKLSEKPDAPVGLSAVIGTGKITLSWSKVDNADSYNVYYGTNKSTADATKIEKVTSPYEITGLTNETEYYLWVTAVNTTGESAYSANITATPISAPSKAPTVVQAEDQLTVTWDEVADAESYKIYYSTTNDSSTATNFVEVQKPSTSCVITGLDNDTTYYVWVKVVNEQGESDFSTSANETPVEPDAAPEAPSKPTLTAGDKIIRVEWSVVEAATSYKIFYDGDSDIEGATESSEITFPFTYTITGLENGTTYYVWIKAVNRKGDSTASGSASTKPLAPPTAPEAPALDASTSATEITVSWSAVTGADSYNVYCSESTTKPTEATHTEIESTSYTITELAEGTTYNVWVEAVNTLGTALSGSSSALTLPAAPEVALTAGSKKITVSWDSVKSATEYKVYYNTEDTTASATEVLDATSPYTITGLTNTTTYNVWVTAANATGTSVFSTSASATPNEIPEAPSISYIVGGNKQIQVTWSNIYNAESYNVYCSESTTKPTEATHTEIESTSYTITELAEGTTYYVWVEAVNTLGTALSGSSSALTLPAAPEVALTAGNGQITVSWDSVKSATEYKVYYNTEDTTTGATEVLDATSSYEITGLEDSTTYYVWVKAKNATGDSGYSTMANTTTLPIAPEVTVTPKDKEINVEWDDVTGATSYLVYHSTGSEPTGLTGAEATSPHTITGLTNGTPYNVWVTAVNAGGESPFSDVKTATPSPLKAITYHANNASAEGDVPETGYFIKDGTAVVADRGDVKNGAITLTDYTFVGWNTESAGTGTTYRVGDTFTINEDTDLYAVWKLSSKGFTFDNYDLDECLINGYTEAQNNIDIENIVIPEFNDSGRVVIGIKDSASSSSPIFKKSENIKTVTFSTTCDRIGDYAFYGCSNLGQTDTNDWVLEIPRSITHIGFMSFNSCTSLLNVRITNSAGIKTTESSVFYGCSNLTNVVLPDDLTFIPTGYFGMTNLSEDSFSFPSELITIHEQAFFRTKFKKLTLPPNLKTLGNTVFATPTITEIIFNEKLESIGNLVFANAVLDTVRIPASVKSIGTNNFYTAAPKTIIVERDKNADGGITAVANSFATAGADIYVPANSVTEYKNATNWRNYATYIKSIDEMP